MWLSCESLSTSIPRDSDLQLEEPAYGHEFTAFHQCCVEELCLAIEWQRWTTATSEAAREGEILPEVVLVAATCVGGHDTVVKYLDSNSTTGGNQRNGGIADTI